MNIVLLLLYYYKKFTYYYYFVVIIILLLLYDPLKHIFINVYITMTDIFMSKKSRWFTDGN